MPVCQQCSQRGCSAFRLLSTNQMQSPAARICSLRNLRQKSQFLSKVPLNISRKRYEIKSRVPACQSEKRLHELKKKERNNTWNLKKMCQPFSFSAVRRAQCE